MEDYLGAAPEAATGEEVAKIGLLGEDRPKPGA
jgi:hypothetical protein